MRFIVLLVVGFLLSRAFASETQFFDAYNEASASASANTTARFFRCGNLGSTCCKGKFCSTGLACCGGTCIKNPRQCAAFGGYLGDKGQSCCGGKCASGFECDATGKCQTCGEKGRKCCGGIGGTCRTNSTLFCDARGEYSFTIPEASKCSNVTYLKSQSETRKQFPLS
jgi:hypothetical protein